MSLNSSSTYEYFTTKDVGSGPVDDDLTGGVIVINYEASLDTVINSRVVFSLLDVFSVVGGFFATLIIIAFALCSVWNTAFIGNYLV